MNSMQESNSQDLPELTWKEHTKLFRQVVRSWRVFGIVFLISFLLAFTVGIVFQIVFIFFFWQAFILLAMLSQPFYSAFLFITKDKRLPRTLPKPPLSAYFSSIIPLLTSVFFLYVGVVAFQARGFCAQSLGCMSVTLVQQLIGK
jgi:hypothetical protein